MSQTCPKPNGSLWKIRELILYVKIQIVTLKNMVIASELLFQSLTLFAKDLPRHMGRVLRTTEVREDLFVSNVSFLGSLTHRTWLKTPQNF